VKRTFGYDVKDRWQVNSGGIICKVVSYGVE